MLSRLGLPVPRMPCSVTGDPGQTRNHAQRRITPNQRNTWEDVGDTLRHLRRARGAAGEENALGERLQFIAHADKCPLQLFDEGRGSLLEIVVIQLNGQGWFDEAKLDRMRG
jgi:hypothetical protein